MCQFCGSVGGVHATPSFFSILTALSFLGLSCSDLPSASVARMVPGATLSTWAHQLTHPQTTGSEASLPDGKYFFFVSDRGGGNNDLYWVDARAILEAIDSRKSAGDQRR
jgi:hypothetical protein